MSTPAIAAEPPPRPAADTPVPIASESDQRLDWNPRWPRFDLIEYIATTVMIGAWTAVEFGVDEPDEANWTGGILFDDAMRDATVGDSADTRNSAGRISNATAIVPAALSFVDTVAVPLVAGGDLDLAWQMTAMNVQAFAATGLLSRSGHRFVARQRPDVPECEEDPEYDAQCFRGSQASFPSGHTSTAMAGAGLVCAHHAFVPLYGHPIADWTACGVNAGLGITTGTLRLVSDRHYFTDVLAGALVGFGFGFGLPILLHYGWEVDPTTETGHPRYLLTPMAEPDASGFVLRGSF